MHFKIPIPNTLHLSYWLVIKFLSHGSSLATLQHVFLTLQILLHIWQSDSIYLTKYIFEHYPTPSILIYKSNPLNMATIKSNYAKLFLPHIQGSLILEEFTFLIIPGFNDILQLTETSLHYKKEIPFCFLITLFKDFFPPPLPNNTIKSQ